MNKTTHKNQMKSDHYLSTDAYTGLIDRLKKRRVIAWIASILIFGGLSLLSGQGLLQTHWFIFLLLSLVSGGWILFFSQLVSWLFFLRPRLKNQLPHKRNSLPYPLANALKKAQRTLIKLCANTGFFLLSIFLLLIQQPDEEGALHALTFSDIIFFTVLSAFLALMAFILIAGFIGFVVRITLFPKPPRRRHSSDFLPYLEDNHPFLSQKRFEADEPHLASKLRENWNHDPMNPASAEYQSTYRYWNDH